MSEIHDFFLILSFRQPTTNVMQHASKRLKTAAELPLLPTLLAVLLAMGFAKEFPTQERG